VSGDDTETRQEAAPFTFVGIKHEVEVSLRFLNSYNFINVIVYVYMAVNSE
jgi:hypothetical protein